jgi:acyl-CoA synthetase (NDP forming)
VYGYARWRSQLLGQLPVFHGLEVGRARRICREVAGTGGGELVPEQVAEVLGAFGIPFAPSSEREGTDLSLGMQPDPLFGPVLWFGLGGPYGEVLSDRVYRITPMTERDAAEMVRSVKGFALLGGYRGHPASDVEAVEETLLRVSRLVEELPELGALDLSVRAFGPGQGVVVLEARISVAPG